MISEARHKGLNVSADVAIHHLFFTDQNATGFNSIFHLQPPLRSDLDRKGLLNALKKGDIQAVCSDHQPHEDAAKHAPFAATEPGVSGLETLLPLGLQLVEQGFISLSVLIAKLTCDPAAILKIEAGSLAVGAPADVTIFDPNKAWLVSESSLLSAGKNSIFIGSELKGKVSHTLLGGEVVFESP
jgi:dihydroorotase